jgi:hypothetical protein
MPRTKIEFSAGVRVAPNYHSGSTTALSICQACGAVVFAAEGHIIPDPQQIHREWHAKLSAASLTVTGVANAA